MTQIGQSQILTMAAAATDSDGGDYKAIENGDRFPYNGSSQMSHN